MNILSQAIAYFNNGDYQKALELFTQVSKIYSRTIVEYHIKKCKEKLNIGFTKEDITAEAKIGNSKNKNGELDIATKILLSNMGELKLEQGEKKYYYRSGKT
ncbi:hypothetical protein JO83_02405 [Avibacterium paragallinarum]|nr:hypothetical protein JO83_02405 [Avibacterium paragallinarum]